MTNFNRVKDMNLDQMANFLYELADCTDNDVCNGDCCKCFKDFLLKDCGIYFKELKFGDKFKIDERDKNIYMKTDTFYLDNPNEVPLGLTCNAVNLKTGLPIYFSLDKTVFKKSLEEIDFDD